MRVLGATGNQRTVTRRTHLRVLPPEGCRIEAWTMGVEPAASQRRVAGETVPLGVARHAALEVLSRRLTVAQEERALGVVVSRAERSFGGEPRAHVTVGAELAGIVAIAAARLTGVCRSRMAGEEAGRMVAWRRVGRIGSVAVETLGPDMAAAAGLRPRVGHGTMQLGKISPMRSGTRPVDHGAFAPARAGGWQGQSQCGLADVAGHAALLGVAGGARHR
jgi:hypothetical protein